MEITASAYAEFDAGHTATHNDRSPRQHGHQYVIVASVKGELDPGTGWPRGTEDLRVAVRELADELEDRNLDDMLPGIVTSPVGIAAWAVERLASQFVSLSSVEVRCSDQTAGSVTRTPR